MTSGVLTSLAPRLLAALVAGLAWAAPARALDLPELMSLLAQRRSVQAVFTEQRFVSGLDRPLRSSGTLSFSAPDNFARRTLLPKPESMVVEGQRVTLERGGRVRQLSLDAVPEVAAIVAAVRGTLTGDAATLRHFFRPTVEGNAERWSITLEPLEQRLLDSVAQLRIEGEHSEVRTVQIVLADGDRSVMQIEPAAPAPGGSAGKPRTQAP